MSVRGRIIALQNLDQSALGTEQGLEADDVTITGGGFRFLGRTFCGMHHLVRYCDLGLPSRTQSATLGFSPMVISSSLASHEHTESNDGNYVQRSISR